MPAGAAFAAIEPYVLNDGATYPTIRLASGVAPFGAVPPSGGVGSGQQTISAFTQRVRPPQSTAPSVSGGTLIEHEFANDQDWGLGQGGHFAARTGTTIVGDGLRLTGELSGGGFIVGSKWYHEEGIVRLAQPFNSPVLLGNHSDSGATVGQLSMVGSFGNIIFRWVQDEVGSPLQGYNFDQIVVPFASVVSTGYFYYRFLKDASGLTLTVNGQTQTIAGVPQSDPATPGTGTHRLGAATQATPDRPVFLLWWRGIGSHDNFGTSDVDSDPKVYVQEEYSPHGLAPATYFDGGQAGLHWNSLGVFDPNYPTLQDITIPLGSTLEVRWVAQDAQPSATQLSGLFSGGWTTVVPGVVVSLGDPQGRYLLVQLRFTPSTTQPLNGATSYLFAVAFSALWNTLAWDQQEGEPVPIPIGFDPVSTGTLPHTPEFSLSHSTSSRVVRLDSEAPYTITYTLSTKGRRTWGLSFVRDQSERDSLVAFFRSNLVFDFDTERGETVAAHLLGDIQETLLAPSAYRVRVQVREVL